MQHSNMHKIATPANGWPVVEVLIPPSASRGAAKKRVDKAGDDCYCLDGFFCLKKSPKR